MGYPFWDVPIGYGVLMATIAVLHVFISHFAIGGGLYLVVSEQRARKSADTARLEFLQKLSKFFALTTLVMGALTGVGIWFVIGLVNPAGTEVLIHNYVWGWAIEWTFFVVEIAAALIYYYGWQRLAPVAHMAVGWIYFIFAWLSLVVINGILSFMLTPGRWLVTGNFWDGFFNPTYWSSLVMRTGISLMLACLYALVVASKYEAGDFKARTVRYTTFWGIFGLVVTLLCQYWYWRAIPSEIITKARQAMPTPMNSMHYSVWLAGGIGLLLVLFGLLLPKRLPFSTAILLMAMGLAWVGAFEWFRESVRKPYIITGYMYGNGVELGQADRYAKEGFLAQIGYRSGNDGADLFRHACRSCHTINGYKALKPAFDGTDRAFIAAIVQGAHLLKGNMPQFLGTPAEADLIAGYLYQRFDQRPLGEIYGLQGVELGKRIYQIRCATCHVPGGMDDKTKSFEGLNQKDLEDMLDNAANLGEGMPAFTGNASERAALVSYILTLNSGGKK
jgi:mono/diheme cytochrome c family protein/cytochrome bd-type quinol oxidase subunit 1